MTCCPPAQSNRKNWIASSPTPGKNWGQRQKWTMTNFSCGDVVLVDLGMTAKVRPCVVISVNQPDRQRNLSVVVPMTTEIRGGECEIPFSKPAWLRQESVVNVLGIAGVDNAKIERRMAAFPADKVLAIESVLKRLLGL
jgi:mRNA interferase MazF